MGWVAQAIQPSGGFILVPWVIHDLSHVYRISVDWGLKSCQVLAPFLLQGNILKFDYSQLFFYTSYFTT